MDMNAQPVEIPLERNPALSGSRNIHARNDDVPRITVYVPLNESMTFCPGNRLVAGGIDSLNFSECRPIQFGSLVLEDSCITYTNLGSEGEDIVFMELCNPDIQCFDFEVSFVSSGAVTLPFSDDFSYDGPFPDSILWLSSDVFINYTLSENPLSVGVATFDGLDNFGQPYAAGTIYSDELTSRFMDVTGIGQPFMSFYVQPKGNGIKPREQDSLTLDFRDQTGRWVRVWQQEGLGNDFPINMPAPDFAFQQIELADSFIHEDFQFRFRNRSKNEGLQELWHLDYVRLGDSEETAEVFEDIAFTAVPKSVLDPYSHMPSAHFTADEVRRNVISQLYNFDQINLAMADPTISVSHDGDVLMSRTFIEPVQNWSLPPGHTSYDFDLNDGNSMNFENLQQALVDLIEPDEKYRIETLLEFSRSSEIILGDQNNEVAEITEFDNYFAYDDGSAESAIIDQGGPGVRSTILAVEYHTNVDDKLQGVQFHFPHIEGDITSQLFNLKIWIDSLDEEPEFEQELIKPYYADSFYDTLQGFTTYDLRDTGDNKIALEIPRGRFFIGWEQVDLSSVKIPVGYDINSPVGADFFYYNVGGGWINVGERGNIRRGTLLVRPVMGNEPVIPTSTTLPDLPAFTMFPNPTTGRVFINWEREDKNQWDISVHDLMGRQVYKGPYQDELDLANLRPGMYLLSLRNPNFTNQISKKLILTQ